MGFFLFFLPRPEFKVTEMALVPVSQY
jgi:hypothetical protein